MKEAETTYEGYNSDQVIAIIVRGTIENGSGLSTTRYWRVDLRSEDAYYFIRNSQYELTVSSINTPGHATPWEAEEEEPIIDKPGDTTSDFIISVNPWDVLTVGNSGM
jgi:hypothetical protein